MKSSKQKSLKILVLGKPNVGKSTLINHFMGEKVSIVSRKAQTTRQNITAITTEGLNQITFIDTPGLNSTKKNVSIKETFRSSVVSTDLLVYVVDDRKISRFFENELKKELDGSNLQFKKKILVINKIDKINKGELLEITKETYKKIEFDETFFISLKKGYGTKEMIDWLKNQSIERNWEFRKNEKSNLGKEQFLCELTREQILHNFHDEIPYNLEVVIDYIRPGRDNSLKIYQTILLTKSSYKPIILGKQGNGIKNLSQRTRLEMEKFLKRKVHLFLNLKINRS
tara:strand:- start:2 stop:856 length:855 start_codon:yes stop_codon:yes gene_type:complete